MKERVAVRVITGGRPALKDRPTAKHLQALLDAGFADAAWVIREDQVDGYEVDDHPFVTYPVEWADRYARAHWRHPTAVCEPGGFHGAFTGREFAMRHAEEQGYDAVLQMDDNVVSLGLLTSSQPAFRKAMSGGEMLALLQEFSASTNAMMLGAQLNSTVPKGRLKMIREGYPYSVFIEKCGPGRMEWNGPYEDDIMHALDYALYGGPLRTAGVVEVMKYLKQHGGTSGMRKHYNASRGLEIARRYPDNVRLRVSRRTSSPNDKAKGVRHFLNTKGFTPIRVTDRERFLAAEARLQEGVQQALAYRREWDREKMRRRGGLTDRPATYRDSQQT